MNTLEDLGEAIKPSDRVYPPAKVIEEPTRLQPQKQEKKVHTHTGLFSLSLPIMLPMANN